MDHHTCSHLSRRGALLGAAGLAATAALNGASSAPAGAATGDSAYPDHGDSGYRVSHYAIDTTILTGTSSARMRGTVTMTCVASRALTKLTVDFQHGVVSVAVDGKKAKAGALSTHKARAGDHGSPGQVGVSGFSVASGRTFTLVVAFDTTAKSLGDVIRASSGYFVVAGQPSGASHWFPCNDRLDVKSTYDVRITTQSSNQILLTNPVARTTSAGLTTASFVVREPVATYQLGVAVGPFVVRSGSWNVVGRSVPFHVATEPGQSSAVMMEHTPEALTYFAQRYGAFPFSHSGGVESSGFGGAQETIGAPTYNPYTSGTPSFIAHETAHMWFGNSVSASKWADVVLIHEGLATLLEWDYLVAKKLTGTYAWAPPAASPRGHVSTWMDVSQGTYSNAAGVMRQLRLTMDTSIYQSQAPRFTGFLKTLASDHAHSSITRAQFKAEAQRAAGKDLSAFWRRYGV